MYIYIYIYIDIAREGWRMPVHDPSPRPPLPSLLGALGCAKSRRAVKRALFARTCECARAQKGICAHMYALVIAPLISGKHPELHSCTSWCKFQKGTDINRARRENNHGQIVASHVMSQVGCKKPTIQRQA